MSQPILRYLFYFSALLLPLRAASQTVVSFKPMAGILPLQTNQVYTSDDLHAITITTFRFYISNITLEQGSKTVWRESNSYHLLDVDDPVSLILNLQTPTGISYDAIHFMLGIDSSTNAAGAQGGELDATRGMYWAWQSGYINLKMEGSSPDCKTRKHEFEFHLGGFRNTDYCAQLIMIRADNAQRINIGIDIARFFQNIDLSTIAEVMIPGELAVKLSKVASNMFIPLGSQ